MGNKLEGEDLGEVPPSASDGRLLWGPVRRAAGAWMLPGPGDRWDGGWINEWVSK